MKILLDGNIYNKLEHDSTLITQIDKLVKLGDLTIVGNQVVEKELLESPYGGIPDWFPVKKFNEPGAFIEHAIIAPDDVHPDDERYAKIMPDVSTYSEHLGSSSKRSDAIIADTALRSCEYVVSEDKRFLRRLASTPINTNCKGLSYVEFKAMVES